MHNCISPDWVQLYVKMPAGGFAANVPKKYGVQKQLYQSRHFSEIWSVTDKTGDEVAVVACKPHSSVLDADSGLIKIVNCKLYQENLLQWILDVLLDLKAEFLSISRLDIAVDFETFAGGMRPDKLIRGFVGGSYVKCGRQSNYKLQGNTGMGKVDYGFHECTPQEKRALRKEAWTPQCHYLKFGSETSDCSYYLYNKSVEMAAVKEKPWIRDHWISNGYEGKEDVWRLEFSIKNNSKSIVECGENKVLSMRSLETLLPENLKLIWAHHFHKYFTWFKNQGESRKDRMKKLILLKNFDFYTVSMKLTTKRESGRSAKVFAGMLMKVNQELRGHDVELSTYGDDYLHYFLHNRGLIAWAKKKNAEAVRGFGEEARGERVYRLIYGMKDEPTTQGNLFDAHRTDTTTGMPLFKQGFIDRDQLLKWGWKAQ